MNGGFGGRFVSALFGAAVGGIASTEIISATGLEARRDPGRHQPAGTIRQKLRGPLFNETVSHRRFVVAWGLRATAPGQPAGLWRAWMGVSLEIKIRLPPRAPPGAVGAV